MARLESQVPRAERCLYLQGLVSAKARQLVEEGLPAATSPERRVCFIGYAYADLALPKRFGVIFNHQHPEVSVQAVCEIVAVTQQWGVSYAAIPHGHKTICVIRFPEGVPAIIDAMPTVDSWGDAPALLGLCEVSAYPAILLAKKADR